MVNKKSTSTAKKTNKKSAPKKVVSKTSYSKKSKPTKSAPKTVHATEPYHPAFGIILLAVCCIICAFLIAGFCCLFVENKVPDSEKFAAEYTLVPKENVFTYVSGKDVIKILDEGTGIVFLGYPSCPWCQKYASLLNDLAKEYGISTIYYHNTLDDWKNDTEEYQTITEILNDHLQFDNVGNKHLYVPDAAFVIDGEIIGNDWETSKDTLEISEPSDYWTEERVTAWKEKLAPLFEQIKAAQE